MYSVYILYSSTLDQFYKGQTNDLASRLSRHNGGFEKFTKKGAPWKLLWFAEKEDRSGAIKFERKLKNLGRGSTINFMLKYEVGVVGPDELLLVKQLSGC